MIKKVLICLSVLVGGIAYFTPDSYHSFSNANGSPGSSTGSPGDNGATCRSCHSGATATVRDNVITTDIPAGGYTPGTTYNITVTASESGRSKFGFEIVSETAAKLRRGKFVAGAGTKTLSSGSRLTHTLSGTSGSNSKTWTFTWTAPIAGTGAITFYGAFNAANSNNNDSGDNIYTFTSGSIPESTGNSVSEYIEGLNNGLSVFPNPAEDFINITSTATKPAKTAEIYSITGMLIGKEEISNAKVDVSKLATGAYILKTELGIVRFVKK